MLNVGDTLTFIPAAYSSGMSNGSEASIERIEQSKVTGTVTEINWKHRWFRVEYKPRYDRKQYECFKF